MFSIGLEFSLPQLKAMRRAVFGLGLAQVAITTIGAMIALSVMGFGWQAGFALGGALAMSSTAIVSKMLAERMELATPHGRDIMGILLFQDLAVVAFLIVLPSLGKPGPDLAWTLVAAGFKAVVALVLILFVGQKPMRAWFHVVARARSPELFMLNVLLITLGLAQLTALAGLSLALGAFLAGMLIAETEYRYQVEDDIKPFRDVLLGLFFVTVGMALDLSVVAAHWGWVLLLLLVPVVLKLALIVALSRAFGAPLATSLRTGFYLAQAGEFALVLLALAHAGAILTPYVEQLVLAAMVLSMLVAPLVIHFAEAIVRRVTANDWLARAAQLTHIAATTMARQDHVVICGFGRSGQNLARLLEREDIPFIALDSDPQRVREAAADGNVVYGDAGRREALLAAGLMKARALADHVRRHVARAQDPSPRRRAEAGTAGHRPHDRRQRHRPAAEGRGGRGRAGGAGRQPHAGVARAAAGRRAARSRAGADSLDPRGALQPLPRLLPRHERRRRRRRESAAAAALGAVARSRARSRQAARRLEPRGAGRSHRRAAAGRAGAGAGQGLGVRGGRRRGAAGVAREPRAGRAAVAGGLTGPN